MINIKEFPSCFKYKFYEHQQKAYEIGTRLDQAAFLMEQGTGKTFPAIAVAYRRYLDGQVNRLLVVAPLSVLDVWKDEFEKFAKFPYELSVLDKKGRKKNLLVQKPSYCLRDLLVQKPSYPFWVATINYESAWRYLKEILKWKPDMIIADESQKIKKGTAKQSRGMHKIGKAVRYKLILTGTPITQNPLDLFSQYKFLNPMIFGTRFLAFRDEYAQMGGYYGYEIIGYKHLKKLSRKAYSIAYRVTQAEALDLPPIINQELRFDLSGRGVYYYHKMKKDLIIELEKEEAITAPIILTKILRLQQITGGFLPLGDQRFLKVNKTKLNQLENLLEDLPRQKKIVIFARFLVEIEAIGRVCKKLKKGFLSLTGKTENRGKVIKQFQKEDDINVIIVQIQTGSLGISLNRAEIVIFYSTTYSYADYDQARTRVHRMGQIKTVNCIHLITKDTIDENILTALKNKWDIARFIIDVLPTLSKERKMLKEKDKIHFEKLDTSHMTTEFAENLKKLGKDIEKQSSIHPDMIKPDESSGQEKQRQILTVKDLAYDMKITPSQLRRKLRRIGIDKPGGRWEWPEDSEEVRKIREL
jgi:SNF2 family DNA or RNA helicase